MESSIFDIGDEVSFITQRKMEKGNIDAIWKHTNKYLYSIKINDYLVIQGIEEHRIKRTCQPHMWEI